ncbi:hypothetical protein [Streptomyces syringium]|uniref:hypothetical protein n=1 Tax=Streptomyces syringium TaxID=76729 RepID=UPI0033E4CE62
MIPQYTRCHGRVRNPAFLAGANPIAHTRRRGNRVETQSLGKWRRSIPGVDPNVTSDRRLRNVRYVDDPLPGFGGQKCEAEYIQTAFRSVLRDDLKLGIARVRKEVNHAHLKGLATYSGYQIAVQHNARWSVTVV